MIPNKPTFVVVYQGKAVKEKYINFLIIRNESPIEQIMKGLFNDEYDSLNLLHLRSKNLGRG